MGAAPMPFGSLSVSGDVEEWMENPFVKLAGRCAMRCLIASLCVMGLAALPAAASANTEGEAMSPEPIVIAYIRVRVKYRDCDEVGA